MIKSNCRGHEIKWLTSLNKWVYTDNGEDVIDNDEIYKLADNEKKELLKKIRPCKKCKCYPDENGYDACLGYIEGAKSACCGHGIEEKVCINK